MFFKEDERRDRMRSQTNETGHPAAESPSEAFFADNLAQKTDDAVTSALGGGCTHNPSFDNIDGTAYRRRDEASREGRSEMCTQIIRHS